MKKFYLFVLVLGSIALLGNDALAQNTDFPWPDLGESMVITPGAPGKINDVIHGDTTATGDRVHRHYILKRGQTYLYTARIQNSGYPLMVTAEEGDGPLPIIKALGPAAGEDEAERIFHAQGDLYIKDLVLNGFDQGGNYTDNATVRLAADSITVVCKSVVFDFNRQNNLRINAKECKLYVEDCIIANQGVAARLFQGFAVHFRGNWTPVVHMRNNTIYNMHNTAITNRQTARYNKLIFENNTVVNTGTGGSYYGRPDSLIVKNNLFVNVGILGDGFQGDRDDFVEPHYYFVVDSKFTDTTNTTLLHPYVNYTNNHYYLDPAVAAALPDSSDKSTETLFHPYLLDLIGEGASNIIEDEAFEFSNFPATIGEYENYINDFYQFAETPSEMPQFETDFRVLDFSYPESRGAYSAATDGGPLGDRNWFPDYVSGIVDLVDNQLNVYPNPASDLIRVRFNNIESGTLSITDMIGREVKHMLIIGQNEVSVNTSDLQNGMYLVRFIDDRNSSSSIKKIILQK